MVTLTNIPIVPSLRKSPHLIAEFYWRLNLCKQIKTKLQHSLQMVQFYWGIIPVNMTSKILMLIVMKIYGFRGGSRNLSFGVRTLDQKGLLNFSVANYFSTHIPSHQSWLHAIILWLLIVYFNSRVSRKLRPKT